MADPSTAPPPAVPNGLRVVSEWCWRCMVILVAVGLAIYAAAYLSFIVVPVIVATMITALLEPIRRRLMNAGARESVASIAAFVVGVMLVLGAATAAVGQFSANYDELVTKASEGIDQVSDWLETGPLQLNSGGLSEAFDRAADAIKDDPSKAVSGTFTLLSTTGGLLAGSLLTFITTLFLVKDRRIMWATAMRATPVAWREPVDRAGRAAWDVLLSYVKVTLTSAVVDSIAIGVAAAILGVPVAFALAIITFLFAFIPTVGAIVSGAVAVLITLVTQGFTRALILAIIVLAVQQLDANVMYPMLARRNLSLHPLSSLLIVAAGGVIGGIVGAFIAVPVVAMLLAIIRVSRADDGDLAEVPEAATA